MRKRTCPYEDIVRRASRTGHWDEVLRHHVAGCETCRDVAAVTRALQALARTPLPDDARRPDPGLIWWKAHLLKNLAVQPPRFGTLLRLQDLVYGLVLALLVGVFWMYGLTWQNTFIRLWTSRVQFLEFPFVEAIGRSLALTVWSIGIGFLGVALSWSLGLFQTDD
jgi:hypothetical protein